MKISFAIYIFCSDTSWLSSLNRLRKTIEDEATVLDMALSALPSDEADQLTVAPKKPSRPRQVDAPTTDAATGGSRGTMMLDHFVDPSTATESAGFESESITGTMTLTAPVSKQETVPVAPSSGNGRAKKQPVILPSRESTTKLQSLQNVCQLIRNARQPYCPLNGVLTLVPFGTIDATGKELEELQRAIKSDLGVIRTETQLRVPITALVVGLESELGFRELVRRVGREKSAAQRFGTNPAPTRPWLQRPKQCSTGAAARMDPSFSSFVYLLSTVP